MPKEEVYTPLNQLKDLGLGFTTANFHFTTQRILDSGVPTAGMTYCGIHDTAEAAEAARQANIVKPWSKTKIRDGEEREFTQADADAYNQVWLESTEVVELGEGEVYSPHGVKGDKIHGENDGATH